MFLIAKIVRGRRLLHQLEQEVEKEKAARALEQREKLLRGIQGSQLELNQQNLPVEILQQGIGGTCPTEPSAAIEMKDIVLEKVTDQQQAERTRQRRQRAVRQRTDSSLPASEEHMAEAIKEQAAMRRTSSMPSIVESEQHLLHRQLPHHQLSAFPRRGLPQRPVRHYNYEDKMSKLQKRALRFTWQRLLTRNGGKRIESVFEEVFDRMMRSLPIMREMFNTRTFISAMSRCEIASPRDHAKLIVKMFESAIKNLEVEQSKRTDTASDFDPKLLGQAHSCLRPYGFTSALWEAFGEAVIDIVLNQEAVRDLPGASQAWVVLTACLVDQLRAGFESARGECPFKQARKDCQVNGEAMHCGRASPPGHLEGSQERQYGEGLRRPSQHMLEARRRTITLADEQCFGIFDSALVCAGVIEAQQQQLAQLQPCAHERRCFSILADDAGGGGEDANAAASAHSRVQLRFLQDMASTEL